MTGKVSTRRQKTLYRQALGEQPAQGTYGGGRPSTQGKGRGGTVVIVLLVILLALLAGVLLAIALMYQPPAAAGAQPQAEVENPPLAEVYARDPVLGTTRNAGQAYVDETLFLGDSNTVRLYLSGYLPEEQVLAESGVGIDAVTRLAIFRVEGRRGSYTMARAVGLLKPQRLVMSFGTNDIGNGTVKGFIAEYRAAIAELQAESPGTAIIVNAIPPVSRENYYEKLSIEDIGAYNEALVEMCRDLGLPFLNSTEALCGGDGYCPDGYTDYDGIHLNEAAIEEFLTYYRTHAYGS